MRRRRRSGVGRRVGHQPSSGVNPCSASTASNRFRARNSSTRTLASPIASASAISRWLAPSTWASQSERAVARLEAAEGAVEVGGQGAVARRLGPRLGVRLAPAPLPLAAPPAVAHQVAGGAVEVGARHLGVGARRQLGAQVAVERLLHHVVGLLGAAQGAPGVGGERCGELAVEGGEVRLRSSRRSGGRRGRPGRSRVGQAAAGRAAAGHAAAGRAAAGGRSPGAVGLQRPGAADRCLAPDQGRSRRLTRSRR